MEGANEDRRVRRRIRRMREEGGRDPVGPGPCSLWLTADVLEFLARLESDRPARRNPDFLAGPRVSTDAALSGLDLEHAEAAKLDALAPHHGGAHGVEDRV